MLVVARDHHPNHFGARRRIGFSGTSACRAVEIAPKASFRHHTPVTAAKVMPKPLGN